MENIANLVSDLGLLITSCTTIIITIKKYLISPLNKKINNLELSYIKTDLVNYINDLEIGLEKSEIQKLNAHELYTRYEKLGGNSYVHSHWENLKKEGKI